MTKIFKEKLEFLEKYFCQKCVIYIFKKPEKYPIEWCKNYFHILNIQNGITV